MKTTARLGALGIVVLLTVDPVAPISVATSAAASAPGSVHVPAIPAGAFRDRTGITAGTIRVGNVSTLALGGLFKGALVGAQAYADYLNSIGGVRGRRVIVDSGNDNFTGAGNKQATQAAISSDAALVGSFSTFDSFGGAALAQHPGVPDVSVVLDPKTNGLHNVFSPVPLGNGWLEGPLRYFKEQFPSSVKAVGVLIADLPSSQDQWQNEYYVMRKVGYRVVYDHTYNQSQVDFTQNVISMRNQGVKALFIDQMPAIYAGSLLKDLDQQGFHPRIVLGAAAYSNQLVKASGGPSAVNGAYLNQSSSLYLGGDKATIPAVGNFLHWVNEASPGFRPDLFTMYGWVSAALFGQALRNAGPNPTRGSILEALSRITTFDGNHIITPTNPSAKTVSNCYLIGRVASGQFQRVDDPPANSDTNGYRCDYTYVTRPTS